MSRVIACLLLCLSVASITSSAVAGEVHEAIAAGDAARIGELLRADPDLINQRDTNRTEDLPIHTAAIHGQVEIARTLLEAGAEVDAADADNSTPLHDATIMRHPEMVMFLLEQGADVNRRDYNAGYALSFAASGGDPAIVQMILDAGADLYHRGANGFTLLHFAAMRGLEDFARILLEAGEDVNARTVYGDTPLKWAAVRDQQAIMRLLLAHGADPDAADGQGTTSLMRAAAQGNLPVGRLLLEWGADVNHVDHWARGPIFETTWEGQTEFARMLIAQGAAVDLPDSSGSRPLLYAVLFGHADLASAFLDAGAETNLVDENYHFTPLHAATIKGYGAVVADLLDHGADADAKLPTGETALDLATQYGHVELANLLTSRGARAGESASPVELSSFADLPEKEAVIWYLRHSGWSIKTKNHFLVFDYYERSRQADQPGLANGHIIPLELAGEDVMVLSSHAHEDHYDPRIWQWRDQLPGVTYVMGFEPENPDDNLPAYELIGARQTRTLGGVKITTIESNDSGVGFLVELDGLSIFHAGDHANRLRDLSGPYPGEIDWLKEQGVRPDIAFLPVSGCGFGDQEAVKIGVHYALDALNPRVFFPMHGGDFGLRYPEIVKECRAQHAGIRTDAPRAPGDHFLYSDGSLAILTAER